MITLYVVSSGGAGKTTICAGLAKEFSGRGKKIGYLRVAGEGSVDAAGADAAFMKNILALPDAMDTLTSAAAIKTALDKAAGSDVVIIEDNLGQASPQLARQLNARVIVIEAYSGKATLTDSYKAFGRDLAGVVINKVPVTRLVRVQADLRAGCDRAGVALLGVVPEDRMLMAPTIGEIANSIGGKYLNSSDRSANLVESLMVGALSVDSGLTYFSRKSGKAAIIRADRPDMQLAALETPTNCIVVSGTSPVHYRVADRAKAKNVPLIQTELDVNTVLARIEELMGKARFGQERKLPRLGEVVEKSFDFPILYKGVGLAT